MRAALNILGCVFLSGFLAASAACGKVVADLSTIEQLGLVSGCLSLLMLAALCWGVAASRDEDASRWDAYRRATLHERLEAPDEDRRRGLYAARALR